LPVKLAAAEPHELHHLGCQQQGARWRAGDLPRIGSRARLL
jgi:hypothetical protein